MSKQYTTNELRREVEAVDSKRNQLQVLISGDEGLEVVDEHDSRVTESSIRVYTPTHAKARASVVELQLTWNGKPVELPPGADALFSSESAIEKFVPTYYSRLLTPEELATRMNQLLGENVIGAVHLPISYTGPVEPPSAGILGIRPNATKDGDVEFF